jgi:hypothetical protein
MQLSMIGAGRMGAATESLREELAAVTVPDERP